MAQAPLIAAIEEANEFQTQTLFASLAQQWAEAGLKVVGLVAEHHGQGERICTSGYLVDLASGERYSIYKDTIPEGKICHVDAEGALDACAAVLTQIPDADLIVLSKFGKLEAGGEGLAAAFETAIAAGKPILTTVSDKHIDEWRSFAPHAARILPERQSILAWKDAVFAAT